uniref:Uncharacterized protein n=1 Tax=uncultured Alphaproteobacteria bacterium TaxID=91750 RepID=A0A1B0Z254_9PROT|nr:hypothetical protein [uncultured Alphaproteobacteria bacterium]
MSNKSDQLDQLLVDTLIKIIREQDTETPSSVLNVARSYVRDNPPEELPMPGANSGILKEFLENIPFSDTKN